VEERKNKEFKTVGKVPKRHNGSMLHDCALETMHADSMGQYISDLKHIYFFYSSIK
jgi:hypothetical protein